MNGAEIGHQINRFIAPALFRARNNIEGIGRLLDTGGWKVVLDMPYRAEGRYSGLHLIISPEHAKRQRKALAELRLELEMALDFRDQGLVERIERKIERVA